MWTDEEVAECDGTCVEHSPPAPPDSTPPISDQLQRVSRIQARGWLDCASLGDARSSAAASLLVLVVRNACVLVQSRATLLLCDLNDWELRLARSGVDLHYKTTYATCTCIEVLRTSRRSRLSIAWTRVGLSAESVTPLLPRVPLLFGLRSPSSAYRLAA